MVSGEKKIYLKIAEIALCNQPAVVSTVLGSCISVFLFSEKHGIGGVNHYALPHMLESITDTEELRYGDISIPLLIQEINDRYNVPTTELTAKVIGGATSIVGPSEVASVGENNICLARQLLGKFHIPIQSESVGGPVGRKVFFHIPSGRVQVALLSSPQTNIFK